MILLKSNRLKVITKILTDFINDFKLETKAHLVCFDATVHFASSVNLSLSTEVHIINILNKAIDVVYLLNPEIQRYGIPDTFESNNTEFTYVKGMALVIKGSSDLYGDYTLSIHPASDHCKPETIRELQTKQWN